MATVRKVWEEGPLRCRWIVVPTSSRIKSLNVVLRFSCILLAIRSKGGGQMVRGAARVSGDDSGHESGIDLCVCVAGGFRVRVVTQSIGALPL